MPWVRFEDDFPISRKVAGLTDAAFRVYSEAICWASRNLTDGIIRSRELDHVRSRASRSVPDLVRRDLWHSADQHCDECSRRLIEAGRAWPPDGWVIHDYLAFQPSAVQVIKDRTAKTQRQARWRAAKGSKPGDASTRRQVDRSTPDLVDAAPSRPAPKEAGRGTAPSDRRPPPAKHGGDGREEHTIGRPPSDVLNGVRAQLRTASHNTHSKGSRREGALDELRALADPPNVIAQLVDNGIIEIQE